MPLLNQSIKPLIEIQNGGCWNWIGSINKKTGYGKKQLNGKTLLAHRWAYECFFGVIAKDKVVNHLCSNRRCVNVAHLEVVTQEENCRHGKGAKLSLIEAKTIKRLKPYKVKGLANNLASRYNVSRQLINDIWSNRAWREI